jgi:hypothetical protein
MEPTISTEDLKAKLDRKDPVKIVETLAPERYREALCYAEIQSEWHRRRRSRVFRSIRSLTMDPFDWRFLILALQVFGTIRSACFDSELLFSRDSLSFPSYSATCSDS